mgnify:CR=1 FL=1
MGRIKEISRKSAHARKRNPVVYLICEGSETEIRYFKRFRSRGCNIDIIPISSQYKSADRLVQKAKATMGNNPYYPEDGDSIWCVFDRDDILIIYQSCVNPLVKINNAFYLFCMFKMFLEQWRNKFIKF